MAGGEQGLQEDQGFRVPGDLRYTGEKSEQDAGCFGVATSPELTPGPWG